MKMNTSSPVTSEPVAYESPSTEDLRRISPSQFVEVFTHLTVHRGHLTAFAEGKVAISGGVQTFFKISEIQRVRLVTPVEALESIGRIGEGDILIPGEDGPVLARVLEVDKDENTIRAWYVNRAGKRCVAWFSAVYVDSPQYG